MLSSSALAESIREYDSQSRPEKSWHITVRIELRHRKYGRKHRIVPIPKPEEMESSRPRIP